MASPGFVGMGPNFSAKRNYIYGYGVVALIALPTVFIGVMGAGHANAAHTAGRIVSHVMPVLLVLGFVGWFAYYFLHNNRKFVISVTGDALTINKRPGGVYAFGDARLGRWAYNDKAMGTVLHCTAVRTGSFSAAEITASVRARASTSGQSSVSTHGCRPTSSVSF